MTVARAMDNENVPADSWEPRPQEIVEFRREVLEWFRVHGRDLPWRRTRDPYHILVSEIMLQQTQVSRVIPYYVAFVGRFPNLASLAGCSLAEVLREWSGLGYNRRALYLKRAAEHVVRDCRGTFPETLTDLRRLPGVGPYTATAIACFAFDVQVPLIETNVRRAIRYLGQESGSEQDSICFEWVAQLLLPEGRAWEWNQAIMDFGAAKGRANGSKKPTKAVAKPPFSQTDRFRRGRIMAILCQSAEPVPITRFVRELPVEVDQYRVRALLESLEQEGMVDLDEEASLASLPGREDRAPALD